MARVLDDAVAVDGNVKEGNSRNGPQGPSDHHAELSPAPPQDDLVPSPDYDLSGVTTKPPPRMAGITTFRGWREVGGWEAMDALTEQDKLANLSATPSILDKYLPSVMYGEWYHNVAYLVGGALISWIIGWLGLSTGPLFFVIILLLMLYRTSMKKYRALVRKEAQREFSVKAIENDYETMDWLNIVFEKSWKFLEPLVSQLVCEEVNKTLASLPIPKFIAELWIDTFTLGTKPPRIDMVRTIPGSDENVVVMDWGFSFTPNSLEDANTKQRKNFVDQKVVVAAKLFGVSLPVSVAGCAFKGLVRVRLRITPSFPHVETVKVSLLEPPEFDFDSKILGESIFNPEVLNIPGLFNFANELIKKYVGPMLFAPLSFELNVQQLMEGYSLNSSIGVLAIRCKRASGVKGFGGVGSTIDPYLTFGFLTDILAQSSIQYNTSNPSWDETYYITVNSLSEPLQITLIDHNDVRKDRPVGSIQFDLEGLREQNILTNVNEPFMRNNIPVGDLSFDLHFMGVINSVRHADGAVTPPPDLNTGIVNLKLVGARNLSDKFANIYAELFVNNSKAIQTPVRKNNTLPSWNVSNEVIISNRARAKAKILIKDKSGKLLGQINCSLNQAIDSTQVELTWYPLKNGGDIRLEAAWKPVALEGGAGAGGYTPPIGAVRVSIFNAEDLRNLEHIGKVDPYVRLLLNGFQRLRTNYNSSTLDPTWNEVHYITVSSPNQRLTIEAMDMERRQADRTLGAFDVRLNGVISKDDRGEWVENVDNRRLLLKLIHKKGPKGTVNYAISFYPALPVYTLQDKRDEEDEKRQKKRKEEKELQRKQNRQPSSEVVGMSKPGIKSEADMKQERSLEEQDQESSTDDAKPKLTLEQLLEFKSGVLMYNLIDARALKDGHYIQIYFENHGYCDFVTDKLKSRGRALCPIDRTGDAVITDIDESKICIRLVKSKHDTRLDNPVAELNMKTSDFLSQTFDAPAEMKLTEKGSHASVSIQCSWIPLVFESGLPELDKPDNCGELTVELLRGENLPAADRSGYSDPYVELYLNTDSEFFLRSKKVKRTLNPTWNETLSVDVFNRFDSVLTVKVWDWDMGPEPDDFLGSGQVLLSNVPTNGDKIEASCDLEAVDGGDGGKVFFKLSFEPKFLINLTKDLNLKSITGAGKDVIRGAGQVGIGVGKGVGTVGKGGLGLGKLIAKGITKII